MDLDHVKAVLEQKGYRAAIFRTGQEACAYLADTITGKTIGFGGSQTWIDLDLHHVLAEKNTVLVPDFPPEGETFRSMAAKAMDTDLFFLSANAMSEAGEIVNIDGIGNRLAGSLFGHQKVYYLIGENKICRTLEEAVWRARNVASPKNALSLHCQTPCAEAVAARLEQQCRDRCGIHGVIDQLLWQRFIEALDPEAMGTHCHDCRSPQRICGSLLIHLQKPDSMDAEVLLIREAMGF